MQREISEKTLELNICAEILSSLRGRPGYQNVVWQGLTQKQERDVGVDAILRDLGPGRSLLLPFKSPWPSSAMDYLYKFSINTLQHGTMESGPCLMYPMRSIMHCRYIVLGPRPLATLRTCLLTHGYLELAALIHPSWVVHSNATE